eukprot:771051-Pleurochrysis_carterae.AAC.1
MRFLSVLYSVPILLAFFNAAAGLPSLASPWWLLHNLCAGALILPPSSTADGSTPLRGARFAAGFETGSVGASAGDAARLAAAGFEVGDLGAGAGDAARFAAAGFKTGDLGAGAGEVGGAGSSAAGDGAGGSVGAGCFGAAAPVPAPGHARAPAPVLFGGGAAGGATAPSCCSICARPLLRMGWLAGCRRRRTLHDCR